MLSIQPYVPHVTSIVNSILHQLSIEFINGKKHAYQISFKSNVIYYSINKLIFFIYNFKLQKLEILTFV